MAPARGGRAPLLAASQCRAELRGRHRCSPTPRSSWSRLVRDGLSNRQIATAMHYSPKTIEVYLSRVYAKTGCASRLELIRAMDTGAVPVDEPIE